MKSINRIFSKMNAVVVASTLVFLGLTLSTPILLFAQTAGVVASPGQLVPQCTGSGDVTSACGYNDLVTLGQNVLTWSIYLATLCAVVSIAWAGWMYLSSGGDSGKIKKAHAVFGKVVTGIIITMCAFLLIKEILVLLNVQPGFSLLN